MKSIKKLLLSIAILLFGLSVSIALPFDPFNVIGLVIAAAGIFTAGISYFFGTDTPDNHI